MCSPNAYRTDQGGAGYSLTYRNPGEDFDRSITFDWPDEVRQFKETFAPLSVTFPEEKR